MYEGAGKLRPAEAPNLRGSVLLFISFQIYFNSFNLNFANFFLNILILKMNQDKVNIAHCGENQN